MKKQFRKPVKKLQLKRRTIISFEVNEISLKMLKGGDNSPQSFVDRTCPNFTK